MLAGFRNAALHGIDEVEVGPVSNAGLRIRRQVRGIENADGGFEGKAATRQCGIEPGLFGIWLVAIPAATGGVENFAVGNIAVWAGIAEAGKGLGALNSQNAVKPSTASSARLPRLRFETSFRLTYPLGRRNFSWQLWHAAPRAGNAALKLASSVVAARAALASTQA